MKQIILGSSIVMIAFLIICIVIYYALNYKNLKNSQKYYENIHQNLKVGKKIEFCGGIYATVQKVNGDTLDVYVSKDNVMTISRYVVTKILD